MLNRRDAVRFFAWSGLTGLCCLRLEAIGEFEPTADAQDKGLREISLRAMGSEMNIRWEDDAVNSLIDTQVHKAVRDLLEKWNSVLSDYDDESEASMVTRPENLGQWQTVSIELAEAVSSSKTWYETSEGAFDVTCGAVTALRRRRRLANPDEWKSAIQTMGWDGLEWHPGDRKIRINRKGLKFDFGGIGKGLAVDKVCSLLREMGLSRFIVNFAGNLRAARAPRDREGWPVEIDVLDPNRAESSRIYKFRIADQSMASSGDQFQSFPDWKSQSPQDRSSHILDPRDGGGLRGRQLVTISTEEASDADAAATAACVQLQRGNRKWIDKLCESGEFLGVAQQLVDGMRSEHEFGGFFEKLKVARS